MATVITVVTAGGAAARSPLVVRPGGILVTRVGGFAASADVALRFDRTQVLPHVRADRRGVATVRVRVPARPGRHTLQLVGRTAGRQGAPVPPRGRPGGDPQVVVVQVPRLVVVPFEVRVPGPLGIAGTGATVGGGLGVDAGSASRDPLADTGLDLRPMVVWSVLLLSAGLLFVAVGGRPPRESPLASAAGEARG